ncbi:MAG: hypothetical protein IPL65_12930 [Lewinellaceae bacterium]|nr:hypothetical protein [Lewinellaceae bacterium]
MRPTLYDLLANRALEFYTNERNYLSEPAYKFYLDQASAFAPAPAFCKAAFATSDSSSRKWQAVRVFQEVLNAHLQDKDPSARISADLQRLLFARNNSVLQNKDDAYESALLSLHKEYYDHAADPEIVLQLANYYLQKADTDPLDNTYRRRAVTEMEDAVQRHPGTYGALRCQQAINNIRTPSLQIATERAVLPNKPLLAEIQYRNLSLAWVKIVALPSDPDFLQSKDWDKQLDYLNTLKPLAERQWTLPDPGDFNQHNTEIKLDALPAGAYAVLVSDNKAFDKLKGYAGFTTFTASELAAATSFSRDGYAVWAVHRYKGLPMQGVKADLFKNEWSRSQRRSERKFMGSGSSDKDGMIQVNIPDNTACFVRLSKDEDTLWLDGQVNNGRYYEGRTTRSLHFFTDRSLYRPGQTVYFKAVLLEKTPDGIPSILKNTPVKITFYDANGQAKQP